MPASFTYPRPLRDGALIAVTAPSSGVAAALHPRLDLVIEALRSRGFRVREGRCLRNEHKHQSADAPARAAEWMATLLDDEVEAVLPPWGGERAIELLPLIDFEALRRARPKWVLGYSDLSTLMLPLTLLSGWATAHGPNLMDLAPGQDDPLTAHALDALRGGEGAVIEQAQSQAWQSQWEDFAVNPRCAYRLTEPTRWRPLFDTHRAGVNFSGRLIGGCLDTLMHLSGSRYGDVPGFVRRCAGDGVVLYLENCEMPPIELLRALCGIRLAGWFAGVSGVLIGRSKAPDGRSADDLLVNEALQAALGILSCPVLLDVDLGHVPPQMTLVNGALAMVSWSVEGGGRVRQELV